MHYRIAVVTPFRTLIPHCGLAAHLETYPTLRLLLSRQLRICAHTHEALSALKEETDRASPII